MIGGMAVSADGALYVTPTGAAAITSGTISGVTISGSTLSGPLAGGVQVLAQSGVQVVAPGDTNENILATVTLPTVGANDFLEVNYFFSCTNNANAKTGRVRLGGIAGTIMATHTLTSQNVHFGYILIANRNSAASQAGSEITTASSQPWGTRGGGVTLQVASADLSVAGVTLVFTGQKGTAGDAFNLEMYRVTRSRA